MGLQPFCVVLFVFPKVPKNAEQRLSTFGNTTPIFDQKTAFLAQNPIPPRGLEPYWRKMWLDFITDYR